MSFLDYKKRLLPGVKPGALYAVDWNNPITKGLRRCYLLNNSVNLVTGIPSNNTGGSFSPAGYKPDFDGGILFGDPDNLKGLAELTIHARAEYNTHVNYAMIAGHGDGQLPLSVLRSFTTGQIQFRIYPGATKSATATGVAIGNTYNITGRYNGANVLLDVDNTSVIGDASTSLISNNAEDWIIGDDFGSSGRTWPNNIDHVFIWDRSLTDNEKNRLNKDPYQFLKPVNDPVYFVPDGAAIDIVEFSVSTNTLEGQNFSQLETATHTVSEDSLTGLSFSVSEQSQFTIAEDQLVGLGFTQLETITHTIAEDLLSGLDFSIGGSEIVTFGIAENALSGVDFAQTETSTFGLGTDLLTGLEFQTSYVSSFSLANNELIGVNFLITGEDVVTFTVSETTLNGIPFTSVEGIEFNLADTALLGVPFNSVYVESFSVSDNELLGLSFSVLAQSQFSTAENQLTGLIFTQSELVTHTIAEDLLSGLDFTLPGPEIVTFSIAETVLTGINFHLIQTEPNTPNPNVFADGVFADVYWVKNTYTPIISGEVAFNGAALTTPPDNIYSFVGLGGVDFSGWAQSNQVYEPFISGGVDFSGTTGIAFTVNFSTAGSTSFTGSAGIANTVNVVGSGSTSFTPTYDLAITRNILPTGGVLFSGDAFTEQTVEYTYTPLIQGEIIFAGDSSTSFIPTPLSAFSVIGSGKFELSGNGAIIIAFNVTSDGKISFSGSGKPDNPTDHQNAEVVEFNLTIKRDSDIAVVIDRELETDVQITRSVNFNHVL